MATLRDMLLPAVDQIRGIPSALGLRPHITTIRIRTWTGLSPGDGSYTDTDYGFRVNQGFAQVKVRNVTQGEVIASGGLYTDQDLVVGPITPPFVGSLSDNDAISIFDPLPSTSAVEVFYRVQGPGYNGQLGDWFKKIAQRTDQPFRYMLWLRKTGFVP